MIIAGVSSQSAASRAIVVPQEESFSFAVLESGSDKLQELQRLRYKVYCMEESFLPAQNYPKKLEWDFYDPISPHIAAFDGDGQIVGGLRLVRHSALGLPIENHAGEGLSEGYRQFPKRRLAEISRLVVDRRYRQQGIAQVCGPTILLGLFRTMYETSLALGIEHWVAAMEPCLWRMLKRYGLRFEAIGKPMEFYGRVIPYGTSIKYLQRLLAQDRPDVFELFHA
ncbi:MAG: GNAT family N-acetyltransferase [Elusimicrobia bacterium]|nr:GNAT family N-acetyltransferase [Elusimicrobiota bacterium]